MARLTLLASVVGLIVPMPASAGSLDRWAAPIAEASQRFGIPVDWIRRVIRVESDGENKLGGRAIVSPAGAMGLMQLMPGTWRDIRSSLSLGSDPFEPRDNILAGTFYLRLMYDRFGYPGLFAAYNAGPGRYGAWLANTARLPAETRLYVANVTGASVAGALQTARIASPPKSSAEPPVRETRASARLQWRGPFAATSNGLFVALGRTDGRCC